MSKKINEFHEPTKWDKFWDKMESKLMPILVPLFTLICDAVVIYTVYYFFAVSMPYAWLWTVLLLAITVPILYFFNKGSIEFIKNWFKKKE